MNCACNASSLNWTPGHYIGSSPNYVPTQNNGTIWLFKIIRHCSRGWFMNKLYCDHNYCNNNSWNLYWIISLVFGGGTQQSSTFENLANQNTMTFGNIAQNQSPGFSQTQTTGFGFSSPQNTAPSPSFPASNNANSGASFGWVFRNILPWFESL